MTRRIHKERAGGVFALLVWLTAFGHPAKAGPAEEGRPRFSLESEEGHDFLEFHLALQLRWEYHYFEEPNGPGWGSSNRILFRRIRPVISGRLLEGDASWQLHLNVVPGSLELMDLWIGYRFHDQVQIRVGQAKIPFTRYRLNSFQDRPVVEWSYPTRWFGAERQMGVTLHNGIANPPTFEYQVGIYTGVNARAANGVGMARVFAEPLESPSSLADPAPFEGMHTEVVAHLAYNHGGIVVRRPTDLEGGPFRFSTGLSIAWDLRPTPRQDMRLRIAPEAEFRIHGFAFQAVGYLGLWDPVTSGETYRLGMLGGLAQLSYVFFERYEVALRYSIVHVLDALRTDARIWANRRIGAAQDPDEVRQLTERYRDAGSIGTLHEVNLGFNWYVFGTTLKWQFDAGLIAEDRIDGVRSDLQLRTQLQLAF